MPCNCGFYIPSRGQDTGERHHPPMRYNESWVAQNATSRDQPRCPASHGNRRSRRPGQHSHAALLARAPARLSHTVCPRQRAHSPRTRLSPPRRQNPGFCTSSRPSARRSLPFPAHAYARGHTDRPHAGSSPGTKRRSRRSSGSGPRHRTPSLRPRRRKGARPRAACTWPDLRSQPARLADCHLV